MTLTEAEAAERAAVQAIGELGRRELAAVKAWVASGCEGPQPQRDEAERERLARDLSAAMTALELAERAA